jgi:hypothetical protein
MRQLLLAVALFALPLNATDFPFGSIATGGFSAAANCQSGGPVVYVHDRGGTTIMRPDAGLAVTSVGTKFVSAAGIGEGGGLWVLDAADQHAFTPFTQALLGPPQGRFAVVLAMAPAGDDALYALVENSLAPAFEIWVVSEAHGLLLRRGLPPRSDIQNRISEPISSIDVDSTGCIVYYTTRSNIARLNVCANIVLPDFVSDPALGVRVLPDGGLLAGSQNTLRRYSAQGQLLKTTALPDDRREIEAIAIDVDPRLAWVLLSAPHNCGDTKARLVCVDIDSGAIVKSYVTDYPLADRLTLAVAGGWTALDPAAFPPRRRRAVH